MKEKVYLVKCQSYEEAPEKLAPLLEMMGGLNRFVKHGEK